MGVVHRESRQSNVSGKHAGAIKDILSSHPQVVKIRYTGTTVDTIRQAWGKWERSVLLKFYPIYSSCCANGALSRFRPMPEVFETYGTSDPTSLCRDPTPNLVRAFLYWICSNGTFKKLDSLLSHSRHWRMAVKYETQCNVPDPIAQDMSLVRPSAAPPSNVC